MGHTSLSSQFIRTSWKNFCDAMRRLKMKNYFSIENVDVLHVQILYIEIYIEYRSNPIENTVEYTTDLLISKYPVIGIRSLCRSFVLNEM